MVDVVSDPNVLEVCTVLFSSLAEVDVQVVQSYRGVAPELDWIGLTVGYWCFHRSRECS